MMHKISLYFSNYNCQFSAFYEGGMIGYFSKTSNLNFSILEVQFLKLLPGNYKVGVISLFPGVVENYQKDL
jgi:hypothetical protein